MPPHIALPAGDALKIATGNLWIASGSIGLTIEKYLFLYYVLEFKYYCTVCRFCGVFYIIIEFTGCLMNLRINCDMFKLVRKLVTSGFAISSFREIKKKLSVS